MTMPAGSPRRFVFKARKLAQKAWISLLIVLALLPFVFFSTQASVTYTSFVVHGESEQVRLQWVTTQEINNAGFYILRSDTQAGQYLTIDWVDTEAEEGGGATYEYIDTNAVINGITYWYQLEAVDWDDVSTTTTPLSAVAGGTPTPTLTATVTTTIDDSYPGPEATVSNATSTPQSYPGPGGSPTAAGTQTPLPGVTNTSVTPGAAFTASVTPSFSTASPTFALPGSGSQTPASFSTGFPVTMGTLRPLPALTLVFPKPKQAALLITATPDLQAEAVPWSQPQRLVPLALVVLIWVALAAWFYYTQRNL
jgi:hypothetical protein